MRAGSPRACLRDMALTLIDVIWFDLARPSLWHLAVWEAHGNRGLVLAWALAVSQMAVVL